MRQRLKEYALTVCLFVFLLVIIGGGFHLAPGTALIGALSGTPLVIYGFNRWCDARFHEHEAHRKTSAAGIIPLGRRL
jgi:hypothetical protein